MLEGNEAQRSRDYGMPPAGDEKSAASQRKTKPQTIKGLRVLIVCMIAFFILAINIFQTRSENLKIETRLLYTSETIEVYSDFNSVIDALQIHSEYYRIFGILSTNPDVRVFYSNCFSTWAPPLYTGRFFSQANTNEAVVGRQVEDTDGYIHFLGNPYRVIGRLGVSGTSLLDNTIILNDTTLFSETVSPYLPVDGDDAADAIMRSFPNKPFFRGADQMRLDVDVFTPTAVLWGRLLAFLSSSLFALFYFDQKKDLLKAKYLIGKPILNQCLYMASFFLILVVPHVFSIVLITVLPSMQVNLLRYSRDVVGSVVISACTFLLCGVRFGFRFRSGIPV